MNIIIWAGRALAAITMAGGAYWRKVLRDSEENGGRKDPRGQGESGAEPGLRGNREIRNAPRRGGG